MPAKRKKERIVGRYYTWLLGKRNDVWVADGRSNATDVGRHSLGTKDRKEAMELLNRLDAKMAVKFGQAPQQILETLDAELLPLEAGRDLYLKHVGRTPVLRGATANTVKRYRAVLDKFIPFAKGEGIHHWQEVSKKVVEAYAAWLDDEGYNYATEYLELTTIKQIIKWLVMENKLPASCLFSLKLNKPQGSTTYCYSPQEVQAMITHCSGQDGLVWLGELIVALATTGLRISEAAGLRWSDLDLQANTIRLTDTRSHQSKTTRATARTLKSHRDRSLPIHPELRKVLLNMHRHDDGNIFHGPLGGLLKPDRVRIVLVREVLTPLANQFASASGEKGFTDGRLHSFRHYFCSVSANSGIPEQVLMTWLGHRDSKMVRRYYHLPRDEAQRQMAKINFVGKRKKRGAAG